MIREGRMFGFALPMLAACLLAAPLRANAGDKPRAAPNTTAAPHDIPHTTNLELTARANKKRTPGNIEKPDFLTPSPGLNPLTFPKYSDGRARLLTPELRNTALVGWIAATLYRDKDEKGWCLEADPGQGEYVVLYRLHLK
jgi:hypothetical protein